MSAKRPAPSSHPSSKRRRLTPDDAHRINKTKKSHPVNDLKSSIRGLSRLLANKSSTLSPQDRIDKERALSAAKHELERNTAANEKKKMISRYHRIRFFDRRKAEKRLRAARKRGDGVEEAEVDVAYTLFYPLHVAYVSLFPSGESKEEGEGNGDRVRGDPAVRKMVVQCMQEGRLEELKAGGIEVAPVKVKPKKVLKRVIGATGSNDVELGTRESKAKKVEVEGVVRRGEEEDDDETGGAFFE